MLNAACLGDIEISVFLVSTDLQIRPIRSVSEFTEFKPRLKPPKNRVQLSASLNFEKLITNLSGTNHI